MAESKQDLKLRREIHVVQDEIAKLGKEFARFNERVRKLAANIQQTHEDVLQVQISSEKIAKRFNEIKRIKK